MSTFECPVVRVSIEKHPDADRLDIATVGGYKCIVGRDQFKTGDLAVYVPEQSVLPEWLLKTLGFWDDLNGKGKLNGSRGNRVRAMKLRGILSQGLLMGFDYQNPDRVAHLPAPGEHPELGLGYDMTPFPELAESQDFAEYLGITKYEPVIPARFAGRAAGADFDATISYDFENIKKRPDLFDDGMDVVITEKLHGTLLMVGLVPKSIWEGKPWADKCPSFGDYKGVVSSKGNAKNGILLDPADEANLYVSKARDLWSLMYENILEGECESGKPVYLFGEIYGEGVQDLGYGETTANFRAFDLYVGTRTDGYYATPVHFELYCHNACIDTVPHLYTGPYSEAIVAALTAGNTTVRFLGHSPIKQIREGVVICANWSDDSHHPRYGRRKAKSVSAAYLLRKGEVTEFQ